MTNGEKRKIASKMCHSVGQQIKYKLDYEDNEDNEDNEDDEDDEDDGSPPMSEMDDEEFIQIGI